MLFLFRKKKIFLTITVFDFNTTKPILKFLNCALECEDDPKCFLFNFIVNSLYATLLTILFLNFQINRQK